MTEIPIDRAHGGIAPEDRTTLDFSVSVGPLGPPPAAVEAHRRASEDLARYPDPDARRLRQALAARHGVPPEAILVAAGSTAAFSLLARGLTARRPAVVVPTFTEIANALAAAGRPARAIVLARPRFSWPEREVERALEAGVDAIFLGRPNSPTGTMLERGCVEDLARRCEQRGAWCVLDEAFVDFVGEEESLAALAAGRSRLVVVRSLTKIFAIPALRVGYAVASPELVARLEALREPWSISGPAEETALVCLAEEGTHGRATRAAVARERDRLVRALAGAGLTVHPSVANFLLVEDASQTLAPVLAEEGIRVRDLGAMPGLSPGFLRIGVRAAPEVDRLSSALERFARRRTGTTRPPRRNA